MVVSIQSDTWFDSLVHHCLLQRLQPDGFFSELFQAALEERHLQEEGGFNLRQKLQELCKRLPQLGFMTNSSRFTCLNTFSLSLDYLQVCHRRNLLNSQQLLDSLISFNNWSQLAELEQMAQHLELFTNTLRASSNDDKHEFSRLSTLMYKVLEWHVNALGTALEFAIVWEEQKRQNTSTDQITTADVINQFIRSIIIRIRKMWEQPFSAILIFNYFCENSDNVSPEFMLRDLDQKTDQIKHNYRNELKNNNEENDSITESLANFNEDYLDSLNELKPMFQSFSTPSKAKWKPCREDFINRRCRPAILTLGSIFSIFRLLKSADEVADSSLTVGEVLGMSHEQIVEDLLRSGFLIQLETTSTSSPTEQRDREALADVFVFLKLPQVFNRLSDRGVEKTAIITALSRICECDSLLDELDVKKSDNVFRFFLDGLRKADVIGAKEQEMLAATREFKRSQNEELLQHLRTTPSTSTNVRSELISRVQKAKRGIDTIKPENTEMALSRILSLGEIPIDMLCSIYCAYGELSIFSSKLAVLNTQAQQPLAENVNTANPQGRLLIFDSTFLLMARIQNVFADLRLEELVGGRLNCAFYRWSQHYQKCIEDGEQMKMQPTSMDFNSDNNEYSSKFDQQQFQQYQYQAMRQQKQPYWSIEKDDFGRVIETIPLLGELLLDEFNRGPPVDPVQIHNIFSTFRQMSCLWLCFVQWLDTQLPNHARHLLARSMCEFEMSWLKQQYHIPPNEKDHNNERLRYSMLLARRILCQMAETRVKKEHPYTWLIGFAQRPLPALPKGRKMSLLRADRDEIKEENQRLKEVFLCANQQGWATPDAIAHINRCNESCRMDIWLQCWMRQMMNHCRVVTVDEGELAAELCLAATITYPVPCLCEMIKQLVECVLFERSIFLNTDRNNIATNQLEVPNQTGAHFQQYSTNSATTVYDQQHTIPPQSNEQQHPQQQATLTKPQSHLSHLLVTRHPVVGQLSTKATILAKILVRAMQLLLWAGDRRVKEKNEREQRLQQLGIAEQNRWKPSQSIKESNSTSSGIDEINESQPNAMEENESSTDQHLSTKPSSDKTTTQPQQIPLGNKQPKDAYKAQLTIRNVFERFERILHDCTIRPPVTFIIFFIHELAQAPRTEHWHRLIGMMPVELLFTLGRLNPPAIPLELFFQIYDPGEEINREKCFHYACMMRNLGQI